MTDWYVGLIFDDNFIEHYGTKRHSGRYPWGSGDNPYQHSTDFIARVEQLRSEGMSNTEIAKQMGYSSGEFRDRLSLAKAERDRNDYLTAYHMRQDGKTNQEIADRLGYPNESSIRSLLKKGENGEFRRTKPQIVADFLKDQVEQKTYIDVGAGVEKENNPALGVSPEMMSKALMILEDQGYPVYGIGIPQTTNKGQQTNAMILCKKGVSYQEVYEARDKNEIGTVVDYEYDPNSQSFATFEYPPSLDSKRLKIIYAEDDTPDGLGKGIDRDGVIQLRPGVEDISLGGSTYAQVRIAVDNTHYLKGMAVYGKPEDFPPGVDVIFNTNKKRGTPVLGYSEDGKPNKSGVLKPLNTKPDGEIDKENPFKSAIKANGQRHYIDENGETKLSVINKRADEGDWDEWKNKTPAQFLSKQKIELINRQLNLAKADKLAEYDDIMSLNNATLRRHYLESFAEDCDSAAEHLYAAALPGQKYQVILPMPGLKDNEIYAPNFKQGQKVALVRFPHGGIFEIPVCTVNNRNPNAKAIYGSNPMDAVAINSTVASQLSGADFDGDTVLVIPISDKVQISHSPKLAGLADFDPKVEYKIPEGNPNNVKKMTNTQTEMGKISNLITDMTLKGATLEELARADRHSMVVIDAEKHDLDYQKSFKDNGIAELKTKYQGHQKPDIFGGGYSEGASTIISQASADFDIPERKGSPRVNLKENAGKYDRFGNPLYDPNRPEGALLYKESGRTYTKYEDGSYINRKGKAKYSEDFPEGVRLVVDKKTGELREAKVKKENVLAMQTVSKMSVVDDAMTLVSDKQTKQEIAYANFANDMKALANKARVVAKAPEQKQKLNKEAKALYSEEVKSLRAKLNYAELNAPRERKANMIANSRVEAKKLENPDMSSSEEKKLRQREIQKARQEVGSSSKERKIDITDREWEAIQAGAVSDSYLEKILNHTDADKLRERAMPRQNEALSEAKIAKIKAMQASGYSNADIAEAIHCSTSTVFKYLE